MSQQHTIQDPESNQSDNTNLTHGFIYFMIVAGKIALVSFLTTYIGLGQAAPTNIPLEKHSISTDVKHQTKSIQSS